MSKLKDVIKIRARPTLKGPDMIAAWPGISNVAMIVTTYIAHKLGVKELAEIYSPCFFDPIGVMVRNNIVESPQFPQSRFYYWKNPHGNDLILFIGEAQPSTSSYSLANCIVDVAEYFKVRRIYTCAAAVTHIHHTEIPKVWGVGTTTEVINELSRHSQVQNGNLQISGMNGILLGVAKDRKVEGACLLGEVPSYATRMHNPIAALVVVQALSKILGIKIDHAELALAAKEVRESMKQIAAEAMGEYIDYFTEPIWESNEDGPEEYD